MRLARNQERELRQWLFSPETDDECTRDTIRQGLCGAIEHDVENDYGVRVELVTVGDCGRDERVTALVAAGREAAINAAKWSGADERLDLHRSGADHDLASSFVTRDRASTSTPSRATARASRCRSANAWSNAAARRSSTARSAPAPKSSSIMPRSSMTDRQPRVFLVDDHELIRSGIRAEIAGLGRHRG